MTHLPPRSNREFMFNKLKWLTVNQLVVYHTLLTMFKIRVSGEPEYLVKYFRNGSKDANRPVVLLIMFVFIF